MNYAKEKEEEKAWRNYVADSINLIPEHKKFSQKYSERFLPVKPIDNRTGDEIASDVIDKLGLTVI